MTDQSNLIATLPFVKDEAPRSGAETIASSGLLQNSALTAAFLTNKLSCGKLQRGKKSAIKITPKPIGSSPQKRLA
jgi:hypothetical protein